ncbi:MAG: FtsX-like permease family protein [Rhodobacterales bacterium]|nr:FtsX-like permease family protein [Rhodobacterales bacterium]
MIAALAWRNIWRQPIRTALSILGMAFASVLLVFMLSFQFGSYDTMKSSMLKISDGFGQFQVAGYKNDPEIDKVIIDPASLRAELAQFTAISASTARSSGFVLLANGERSFAAAVVGIDPVNEPQVSTLSTLVKQGRALTARDTNSIIIGDGLARNLRLSLGDPVTMLGTGMDGSIAADVLVVKGIFKTGVAEIDRQIAQIPIARFDEAFLMDGAVNVVAISGDDFYDIENLGAEMRDIAVKHGLVYLDWAELQPAVKSAIALDMSTAMLMYATLVIVVVFIILNTLYMSVLERTREFGMLLALGMKPAQIGRLVWAEMIFLSLLGTGIGVAIGIAITAYVQSVGIAFEGLDEIYAQWGLPSRMYPKMTLFRVLIGPGAIVVAISVLGVIPYRRALGLEPVPAMAA